MAERNTRLTKGQIKNVDPSDLEKTGDAPAEGQIPSYDVSTGLFKWAGKPSYMGVESIGEITFADDTHILSIASITYWFNGIKYVTASPITGDIDVLSTLVTNTTYFFYFDAALGALKCNTSPFNFLTIVPIATVFWNGTNGAIAYEAHGYMRDLNWHRWSHDTIGTRYRSGLSLTKPTVAIDNALQIESGYIHDEDLERIINQATTCRIVYKASLNVYTWVNSALPYAGSGVQPRFLNITDYTLTNVSASDFVCMWVYATMDIDRQIYIIPTHKTTSAHNTIALARAEVAPNLADLNLSPEFKLIYRFIYKGNGDFQESNDYRLSQPVPSGGVPSTNASSVSFSPTGDIVATTVQVAIEELDTEKTTLTSVKADSDIDSAIDLKHAQNGDTGLGAMSADINMNTHQLTALSAPDANGEAIRATTKITEVNLEDAVDKKHSNSLDHAASGQFNQATTGEILGLTDKPTPLDADVALIESVADSNAKRKLTWTNIKTTLKTYFEGIVLSLYNGTTATTQAQANNSTKIATTAYVDTGLGTKVKNDGSVNPVNLITNGDFEDWTAGVSAVGWTYVGPGGTVGRQDNPAYVKMGIYSAAITRVDANACIRQSIILPKGLSYWKGRTIILGCWVKCATANVAQISIYDGVAGADSSYHTGDNTWQFLTATCAISNSATALDIYLFVSNTNTYAHFDGAMCVEGGSIFAFSDKPAPITSPTFITQITTPIIALTGGQIAFPASQNASADANTLDDYEEGTWTPTKSGFTEGGGGSYTLSGTYTKIGRRVFITAKIVCSSGATLASVAVTSYLSNLPFAVAEIQGFFCLNGSGALSLGGGVLHTNGNMYMPTWSAPAANTTFVFNGSYIVS